LSKLVRPSVRHRIWKLSSSWGAEILPDDFIAQLEPYLEKGDIIIDGGNSHFPDSIRRTHELEKKGFLFVGSGVSGGEEGARYGPSLSTWPSDLCEAARCSLASSVPGGSDAAWPHIKEIFQKTAAQSDGEVRVSSFG
jgi:6-phosphogluconate dehydrogenase